MELDDQVLPELRPRTVDPSRPHTVHGGARPTHGRHGSQQRGGLYQRAAPTTPTIASLMPDEPPGPPLRSEQLLRRPHTTEGAGQRADHQSRSFAVEHALQVSVAQQQQGPAARPWWSASGGGGASFHGEMGHGALYSIAASSSFTASFVAAWEADDTIATELGLPQVSCARLPSAPFGALLIALGRVPAPQISVPRHVPLADVFSVIEARERAVAALRGFLASQGACTFHWPSMTFHRPSTAFHGPPRLPHLPRCMHLPLTFHGFPLAFYRPSTSTNLPPTSHRTSTGLPLTFHRPPTGLPLTFHSPSNGLRLIFH